MQLTDEQRRTRLTTLTGLNTKVRQEVLDRVILSSSILMLDSFYRAPEFHRLEQWFPLVIIQNLRTQNVVVFGADEIDVCLVQAIFHC